MEPYDGQCLQVMFLRRQGTGHSRRANNYHICELPAGHSGPHSCPACGMGWERWVQDALPCLHRRA